MSSSPNFNPSCPLGGSWYACGNSTRFVGCCSEYPCTDTGCSRGNLYPASFDQSQYGTFHDQECSAGEWYTCAYDVPPFLGCCKTNPCSTPEGCPSDNLAAGFLSSQDSVAQEFDPHPPLTNPSNSTPVPPPAPSPVHSTRIASIIGGSAGGGAFLLIIGILYWYYRRIYKSKRSLHTSRYHRPPPWRSKKKMNLLARQDKIIVSSSQDDNVYEAPDSPVHLSTWSSPAPRYSSQMYHEVSANIDAIQPAQNHWSPQPPPGSPNAHSAEISGNIGSVSPYASSSTPLRSTHQFQVRSHPPLEYDEQENAWINAQTGLGIMSQRDRRHGN